MKNIATPGKANIRRKVERHPETGWRTIVMDERELVASCKLYQDTFRLDGYIPTWDLFMQTRIFHQMSRCLDANMLAKYRAWWNLLLECYHPKQAIERLGFAWTYLLAQVMHHKHGQIIQVNVGAWGLEEEQVAGIKAFIQANMQALTSG